MNVFRIPFLGRVLFSVRYRTWGRVATIPGDSSSIVVYHRGRVVRMRRRCPHQGGPLNEGYFRGDDLLCPWHGCRFSLLENSQPKAYEPTADEAKS
jgi:hypothetical protein